MLKREFELKRNITLDEDFLVDQNTKISHCLIKKIEKLHVNGAFNYQPEIKSLIVNATIIATILATDARDGNDILLENQEYDWNEEYYFEDISDDQHNIVFGDNFSILDYAIEQIVLNIPMNLTKNYDTISFVGKDYMLMSEEEYQQEQESTLDSRWDKLKDFNFEK